MQLSRRKKLLYSVVTVSLFFLLLEFVLLLCGLDPVTKSSDPYVGFSGSFPLFEEETDDSGQVVMQTDQSKLVWFNDQRFLKRKPANTRRIFCLGGSTTYGRPYHDLTAFSGWLRAFLPSATPGEEFEVINAGGVSYASYRVAIVMEELLQYEPDLFVIYTGQNEFLERRTYDKVLNQSSAQVRLTSALSRTRTWALVHKVVGLAKFSSATTSQSKDMMSAEVNEILNHTIGPTDYHRDLAWREQVVEHFRYNLRRMIQLARRAGAKVVFVTPASNLKDCSPFKSEFSAGLASDQQETFSQVLSEATQLIADGQSEQALRLLDLAEEIDDRYAELHFRRGKAVFALGEYESARQSFMRALNEDVCPLRAVDEIVAAVREVAAQLDCPLIDYEQQMRERFRNNFEHECVGDELFFDHVHPNIEEHRQLALSILTNLDSLGWLKVGPEFSTERIAEITSDVLGRVDQQENGVALRNLAKVMHWAGKFPEALSLAERAVELIGEDPASLYVAGDCCRNTGDLVQSLDYFNRMLASDPFDLRGHQSLGELLLEREQYEDATFHLKLVATADPMNFFAQRELGVALFHLGGHEDALHHLQEANTLRPKDLRTLHYMAHTLLANESDEAAEWFELLVELAPDVSEYQQLLNALNSSNE